MISTYKPQIRTNIGALWSKKCKKEGKQYFIGRITIKGERYNIVAFLNTEKRGEREPDFLIRHQQYLPNKR